MTVICLLTEIRNQLPLGSQMTVYATTCKRFLDFRKCLEQIFSTVQIEPSLWDSLSVKSTRNFNVLPLKRIKNSTERVSFERIQSGHKMILTTFH